MSNHKAWALTHQEVYSTSQNGCQVERAACHTGVCQSNVTSDCQCFGGLKMVCSDVRAWRAV